MARACRANNHEENRCKVCVVSIEKGSYKVSEVVLTIIQNYLIENYDINEACCPASICGRCRPLLLDIDSGKKDVSLLPEPYDFSQITPYMISFRLDSFSACRCNIC